MGFIFDYDAKYVVLLCYVRVVYDFVIYDFIVVLCWFFDGFISYVFRILTLIFVIVIFRHLVVEISVFGYERYFKICF